MPVDHPDGPEAFKIALFEEAVHHLRLRKEERATRPPYAWNHDEFIFMGREWATMELVEEDGTWIEANLETIDLEDWFREEGCWIGRSESA